MTTTATVGVSAAIVSDVQCALCASTAPHTVYTYTRIHCAETYIHVLHCVCAYYCLYIHIYIGSSTTVPKMRQKRVPVSC